MYPAPKTGLFALLLAANTVVFASPGDTLRLGEVRVVAPRHSLYQDGTRVFLFDSLHSVKQSFISLSQLLSSRLPHPVQCYGGQGSLAGIMLRGTNGSHTIVAWNGFPINSPTTGTHDLSLVNAAHLDKVSLHSGVPGSVFGFGTIGGVISLSNQPDFGNRLDLQAKAGAGSYGERSLFLGARAGTGRMQVHLGASAISATNDFRFVDTYKAGAPVTRQEHNAFTHTSVSQNLYWSLDGGNTLELGAWYQHRDKDLPAIMGSYAPSLAEQSDSSLRLYASWSRRGARSMLKFRSAWMDESVRYTDRNDPSDDSYSVDSRIRSLQSATYGEYRFYFSPAVIADAGGSYTLLRAEVTQYGKPVSEQKGGVYGGIRISKPLWTLSLTLLKEWVDRFDPPLQLGLNGQSWLVHDRLFLAVRLSNHYHVPGMNDRYWQPGGNPMLRPEKGWGGDAGLGLEAGDPSGKHQPWLSARLNLYLSRVTDWIQWVPSGLYWTPLNVDDVRTGGLESSASSGYSWRSTAIRTSVVYLYTRSMKAGAGDNTQLPYVPLHAASFGLSVTGGRFSFSYRHKLAGCRYSTSDNSAAWTLDPYQLSDITATISLLRKSTGLDISIQVRNLWNEQYQLVRSYAMPGRTIHFNLILHHIKKKEP